MEMLDEMTCLIPLQFYSVHEHLSHLGFGLDGVNHDYDVDGTPTRRRSCEEKDKKVCKNSLSRSELNSRLRHLIERSIEVVSIRGKFT